ncbi:MAG: hypothetical protein V4555_11595 [Acidobacteriota bacterium]
MLGKRGVVALGVAVIWAGGVAVAQSGADGSSPAAPVLSANALVVARELGVDTAMKPVEAAGDEAATMRALLAREQAVERLLVGSLQIDTANAAIDEELEQMRAVREKISARRDKAQGKINMASLVAGALGTVGTALQFRSETANLGNGIGVAGGSASVALSLVGMHEQGGRMELGSSPRMLGELLMHDAAHGDFPAMVWAYLNAAAAGESQTRRELLIAKWTREGKLTATEAMSGGSRLRRPLSIDELNDHYAMLLDLKAAVERMKASVGEVAEAVVGGR